MPEWIYPLFFSFHFHFFDRRVNISEKRVEVTEGVNTPVFGLDN